MKRNILWSAGLVLAGAALMGAAGMAFEGEPISGDKPAGGEKAMSLGNFSVSLNVKDLAASKAFYEKLGFKTIGGDGKSWQIMQTDTATIGLFQGMFPKNTLTFNPGWDRNSKAVPGFEDVRSLQKTFKARGLTPEPAADEASTGTAFFMLLDPDGNPVLFDQHVPAPGK
jgi:catechol 2,3-dioxygenase-like lactoylglutathione lyase family enzyme